MTLLGIRSDIENQKQTFQIRCLNQQILARYLAGSDVRPGHGSALFGHVGLKWLNIGYTPVSTALNRQNVKNCSLSTTYNGDMTHRKQQK